MIDAVTQHADFVIERTFDAAPEAVFAAWSDPAAKRRWFAEGEGFSTDIYALDFREGGEERWVGVAPNGMKIENNTRYFDIIENRRIVSAYAMIVDGRRISASLSTIILSAKEEGALLAYREQAAFFDGGDGPEIRKAGWEALFQSLSEELAR